ncbi:MAG: Smr/MutS family protein [bacterium]|nr:Smr/MutS family protein [bacterium]
MVKLNIFSWFTRLFRPFKEAGGALHEVPLELKNEWQVKEKKNDPLFMPDYRDTDEGEPLLDFTMEPPKAPAPPVEERVEAPPVKKKQKRRKRVQDPSVDTKGFRIITDQHNLHELFSGEEERKGKGKRDEYEDFARMFAESETDRYQLRLMEDKKRSVEKEDTSSLTASQQIKAYPPPEIVLDLHGYTAVEAESATEAFIRKSRAQGIRTVRLITGKGTHSQGKAVLPDVVERKLIQLKRQKWVLGFNWEKKDKRKSGAVIVFLIPI